MCVCVCVRVCVVCVCLCVSVWLVCVNVYVPCECVFVCVSVWSFAVSKANATFFAISCLVNVVQLSRLRQRVQQHGHPAAQRADHPAYTRA